MWLYEYNWSQDKLFNQMKEKKSFIKTRYFSSIKNKTVTMKNASVFQPASNSNLGQKIRLFSRKAAKNELERD